MVEEWGEYGEEKKGERRKEEKKGSRIEWEGEARKRKIIGKVEEGEKEVGREGGGKEDRWS